MDKELRKKLIDFISEERDRISTSIEEAIHWYNMEKMWNASKETREDFVYYYNSLNNKRDQCVYFIQMLSRDKQD